MCRSWLIMVLLWVPLAHGATAPITVRKVALRTLNATPDQFLGETVTFEAVLPTGVTPTTDELPLRIDATTKATNLRFVISPLLLGFVKEMTPSPTGQSMRVIGNVIAPQKQNGPYGIEVTELQLLAADGTVVKSSKVQPGDAVVKTEPPKPKVQPAATDAPPSDPSNEEIPKGTLIAAGIAIFAGAGVATFLLFRRRKRSLVEPPPPSTSVTDRLNRRVR